jgi:hypothetical protein
MWWVTKMWIVERSDIDYRSPWASRRDAKCYIRRLGLAVRITSNDFDVCLPTGKHVTATLMRA